MRRNGAYAIVGAERATVTPGWHFIVGTYDGRYTTFDLDCQLIEQNDAGGYYPIQYAANNSLIIGADASNVVLPDANSCFGGKIGEVVMVDRTLSGVQKQRLYRLTQWRYK
jgi:hypothetical protein